MISMGRLSSATGERGVAGTYYGRYSQPILIDTQGQLIMPSFEVN